MNPNKAKFYYNCMAILLLAVPVLIWLSKLSGHEMIEHEITEHQKAQVFPAGMEILILAAGMVVGILYFVSKYARSHSMTTSINKRQDFPDVFVIIEMLCNKLNIDIPEVCFLESSIPNAFVYKHQNKPIMVLTIPLMLVSTYLSG